MAGLDNKISNIIGTKLPQWLLSQIQTRSINGARDSRDNSNILYLTNKSAWVRLVSSIDLVNQSDLNYFNRIVGDSITSKSDLAKQFVLFGGTSKYLDKNSYQLRSGIGAGGAYGTLGKDEIQRYGYKPMPGITNVAIETQGRLGSVRSATINFKCWDKAQLDIMDALYFKLGFTMFLEWGNTAFYSSEDPNRIQSSELYSVDPFQADLSKEEIYIQVAKNSRQSEGNYDGMLGIVTNFSFTYTQDGGFDCQLRLMALGVLADSLKINNVGTLPGIVQEEIRILSNTLIEISNAEQAALLQKQRQEELAKQELEDSKRVSILRDLNKQINGKDKDPNQSELQNIVNQAAYIGSKTTNINEYDFLYDIKFDRGKSLFFPTLGAVIPTKNINQLVSSITIDTKHLFEKLTEYYRPANSNQAAITSPVNQNTQNQIGNVQQQIQSSLASLDLETKMFFDRTNPSNTQQIKVNINYLGQNKKTYYASIITEFGRNNPNYKKEIINQQLVYETAIKQLKSSDNIEFTEIAFEARNVNETTEFAVTSKPFSTVSSDTNSTNLNGINFYPVVTLATTIDVVVPGTVLVENFTTERTITVTQQGTVSIPVTVQIKLTDTDLISAIAKGNNSPDYLATQKRIVDQNQTQTTSKEDQAIQQKALETQISEALNSQSALELTLRAIQLHALNRAITLTGNLDIGKSVFALKMTDANEKIFLNQIFSNGIFSDFINELIVPEQIENTGYNDNIKALNRLQRLKIQSKYGFASSLMGNSADINTLQACDFDSLLKAFVVPYQINQEIIKGTSTNHPVYIPLGLLLMVLNHCCTIYDSKEADKTQTPLVYIDFNTAHNYFLSNTKQLSTNPWVTLIRFEGSFNDYKKLFDPSILNGDNIKPPSGSQEVIPLFNPATQDVLTGQIPRIKFDGTDNNIYRGKMMNILLNVDYLIKIIKDFSYKDGTNSIYLKEFIEQILTDVNKYLGKINVFRLSYNDKGNTLQIIDDQFIPVKDEEDQIGPNDVKTTGTILSRSNTTELPLIGKYSIAKTLDIKSDISSKLSNTLAISANADVGSKASLSKNGDNYGYINTSYQDRYIVNRLEVQNTNTGSKADVNLDSIINSAVQFNQTISDFYSKINPSETSVDHATNYFIDKMTKIKNDEYPTRASAMIPVSVNFSTDGISGFLMGQAFTIPDELLPYTYNARVVPGEKGLQQDHINKVGFVVVGLGHTLENNQWTTNVRANMIFLKDKTEFSGSVVQTDNRAGVFTENQNNPSTPAGQTSIANLNINEIWEQIAFDFISKKEGFLERPRPDEGTLRAGYGTDKIVLADGTIKNVGSDTVFSREDAKRTLVYQIKTTFAPRVIFQIGQQNWNSLNDKQKASLVSFTYNAGSLTESVVTAIKSNTGSTAVASAITLGPKTGKVSGYIKALETRRKEEATLYLS
jgi:GH24 family phage-related lysozyme (muramidase)